MTGPTVVMLSAAAMLSLAASQPTNKPPAQAPAKTPPPTAKPVQPPKIVSVELIVDTLAGHEKLCKGGKVEPTTILIVGKEPYYCVGAKLVTHDEGHNKFKQTMVQVSSGQSVRWFSKTRFRVAQIQLHEDKPLKGAPPYPFTGSFADLPKELLNEVTTPPVIDVDGNITARYKVSFDVDKQGIVDPDVVCSM